MRYCPKTQVSETRAGLRGAKEYFWRWTHGENTGCRLRFGERGMLVQIAAAIHQVIGGQYRLLQAIGAGCAQCGPVNLRWGYDALGRLIEQTTLSPVIVAERIPDALLAEMRKRKFGLRIKLRMGWYIHTRTNERIVTAF